MRGTVRPRNSDVFANPTGDRPSPDAITVRSHLAGVHAPTGNGHALYPEQPIATGKTPATIILGGERDGGSR